MKRYQINATSTAFSMMDDEATVIHTESSDYFSLNKTATYAWNLMVDQACSATVLIEHMSAVYKQESNVVSQDIQHLLAQLVEADLVVVSTEGDAKETAIAPKQAIDVDAYDTPDMVRFGNLETLILSGE